MKLTDPRIISAAVLFVLIIVSGFWVTKLGRPLHAGPMAVHKLAAIACLVFIIIIIRSMAKGAALDPLTVVFIVLTFAFFAVMIATGGMLSFEKTWPGFVKLTHKIVPYLTLAASAAAVLMLEKAV